MSTAPNYERVLGMADMDERIRQLLDEAVTDRKVVAIRALIAEAVEAERRLMQRELDHLRAFQKAAVDREARKTEPLQLCAGCSAQLAASNPQQLKDGKQ
jgi:uncharacterized protein with von Willebrand factor type A (vWA) domain